MRSLFWMAVGACVILTAASQTAEAVGLGMYTRYGTSSVEAEIGDSDFDSVDMDRSHLAIGLALDTAVARQSVFNYRLELGYTEVSVEYDRSNFELDFTGGEINNTFGFAIVRSHSTRIWLGPTFRLSGGSGEVADSDIDASYIAVGAGAVLGGNHHLGSVASICWSLGYVYQYGVVLFDEEEESWGDSDDITLTGGGFNGTIAMIFHLGGEER